MQFTNQDQTACSLVTAEYQARRSSQSFKWGAATPGTWEPRAFDGDPNKAEAEEGAADSSGLGFSPLIWPPPNACPVGSELRLSISPQAAQDLEDPAPGRLCQKKPVLARKSCEAERKWPGGKTAGSAECLLGEEEEEEEDNDQENDGDNGEKEEGKDDRDDEGEEEEEDEEAN
ncbi:hypothetical protein TREES_T100016606 [Tupaia chinensis]|uniref:Uncharacterized protein n=1 Tax=Tupaia chinensis TaxID=246437 RepID=L9L9B1_TUPCH|nr:hypothetical protein TREES_T100016606 [Tupaia chinensis]